MRLLQAARRAGWRTLFVPAAEAVHHDQLSTDLAAGLPRIVEFHRNRDLYMRKHHSRAAALAVRLLTAWSYALRALAATVLPSHPAHVYRAHARQALLPGRGREKAPRRVKARCSLAWAGLRKRTPERRRGCLR